MSISDYTIDACRWHVDAEAPDYKQRALDHFRDSYTVLLEFLREEGLLVNPNFGSEVEDWYAFQIRTNDLTAEGHELFKRCASWNPSYGHARSSRHLVQWRKKLAVIRGTAV